MRRLVISQDDLISANVPPAYYVAIRLMQKGFKVDFNKDDFFMDFPDIKIEGDVRMWRTDDGGYAFEELSEEEKERNKKIDEFMEQ